MFKIVQKNKEDLGKNVTYTTCYKNYKQKTTKC